MYKRLKKMTEANMTEGDFIIKYKIKQSINRELDQKIEKLLKSFGYKWTGSGIGTHDNVRDIAFIKED